MSPNLVVTLVFQLKPVTTAAASAINKPNEQLSIEFLPIAPFLRKKFSRKAPVRLEARDERMTRFWARKPRWKNSDRLIKLIRSLSKRGEASPQKLPDFTISSSFSSVCTVRASIVHARFVYRAKSKIEFCTESVVRIRASRLKRTELNWTKRYIKRRCFDASIIVYDRIRQIIYESNDFTSRFVYDCYLWPSDIHVFSPRCQFWDIITDKIIISLFVYFNFISLVFISRHLYPETSEMCAHWIFSSSSFFFFFFLNGNTYSIVVSINLLHSIRIVSRLEIRDRVSLNSWNFMYSRSIRFCLLKQGDTF